LKLTHLGLEGDRDACVQDVLALARKRSRRVRFLDRHGGIAHTSATLDVYRRAKAEWSNVGALSQAYLRRTPADLESLLALAPAIRLVKERTTSRQMSRPKKRTSMLRTPA